MLYLFGSGFCFFYLVCLGFFWFLIFWGGLVLDFTFFVKMGMEYGVSFMFDFLSLGFFSSVSFISSMVFFYSMFYMEGTVDFRRFGFLVMLFVVSMFLLVFSGNFFMTMIGWDGLGLVSFCLVVYYSNSSSLESGLITVFSNRVGDVFFLLTFFMLSMSGWWTFDGNLFSNSVLLGFFVFSGAVTKSAQIPFSAWLPAAMAAPTPVSSLVHSSTLVTAGIYVLIRFNYVFSILNMTFFKIFSIFTMLLAGISACVEKDFKKVVAMSTLSQLGMMLFILSVKIWILTYIHMIIHAFFKSMLFLSTGSLMSQMAGNQESRIYGGSIVSYGGFLYFLTSGVCLSGFPFFSGFYSKDQIIFCSSLNYGWLFYVLFVVGCFFTVCYSMRLLVSGYVSFFKGFIYISNKESFFFWGFVGWLFMKSCIVGSGVFWFFLSEFSLFFSFWDLVMGMMLIILGSVGVFWFKVFYGLTLFMSTMGFLKWLSTSGISFVFKHLIFFKKESKWMEIVGGQGFFKFVSMFTYFSMMSMKLSLGSVMGLVLGFGLYFT